MASLTRNRRRDWSRQYPSLLALAAAIVLAAFALPSALVLPQASPSQTMEYAPVPPNSNNAPNGNLSSLGLGSSGTLGEGGSGQPPALPGGVGQSPTTFNCVGNPPRQTEDPLSPPCVAFFNGSNGGATYPGVTGSEIRVLTYVPGGNCSTGSTSAQKDVGSQGTETRPAGTVYDLARPPQANEPYTVVADRIWQRYFNQRYQTYNRRVHFYLQYATDNCSDSRVASDAASDEQAIHPFAVVFPDIQDGTFVNSFGKDMAHYGVLSFGGSQPLPASFYSANQGRIWSYIPSADQYAQQFAGWVCAKIVNKPVATTLANRGAPRKLGIMYPASEHSAAGLEPGSTYIAGNNAGNLLGLDVQSDIERCSGNAQVFGPDVATINDSGGIEIGTQDSQDATVRMQNFRRDGVTTVVWAGGFETNDTQAAASLGYQPEWIVAGDNDLDDLVGSRYQDQTEWSHAWAFTDKPLEPAWQQTYCFLAIKETDPNFPESDTTIPCRMYADFRLFFTAVQVAGPHLDPAHVDQGLHAIPGVQNSDPQTPACFFNPGDYTCVKDSIAMWWDESASSQFSQGPGCYRVPEAGRRFLPGGWQGGNVDAQKTANDPCNGYVAGTFADPAGQGPGAPPAQ